MALKEQVSTSSGVSQNKHYANMGLASMGNANLKIYWPLMRPQSYDKNYNVIRATEYIIGITDDESVTPVCHSGGFPCHPLYWLRHPYRVLQKKDFHPDKRPFFF